MGRGRRADGTGRGISGGIVTAAAIDDLELEARRVVGGAWRVKGGKGRRLWRGVGGEVRGPRLHDLTGRFCLLQDARLGRVMARTAPRKTPRGRCQQVA